MNSTTYTPGKYQAVIKDFGWTEASTGTPQFFIDFEVTGRYDKGGKLAACPRFLRTYYRAISTKGKEAQAKCVNMLKGGFQLGDAGAHDLPDLRPGNGDRNDGGHLGGGLRDLWRIEHEESPGVRAFRWSREAATRGGWGFQARFSCQETPKRSWTQANFVLNP
jgi:hypothetical protein